MIHVGIVDGIHLFDYEIDAKSTDVTLFPRHIGVRFFLFQGVERHTAILETDDNAVGGLFNFNVDKTCVIVGIGV